MTSAEIATAAGEDIALEAYYRCCYGQWDAAFARKEIEKCGSENKKFAARLMMESGFATAEWYETI